MLTSEAPKEDPKYCMFCKPKVKDGRVVPVELEKNKVFGHVFICPRCKTEYHTQRASTELYITVKC